MKPIFIILLWCFFQIKPGKNDLQYQNLKGRVKSMVTFDCAPGFTGKMNCAVNNSIYDIKGNLVEHNEYSGSEHNLEMNRLFRKHIFGYDTRGNRISASHYDYEGKLEERVDYKFDDHGNPIEKSSKGEIEFKYNNKYDAAGNKTESALLNPDGSLWSRTLYKYDLAGNLTESNKYDAYNQWLEKREYDYDTLGNQTLEKYFEIRSSIPVNTNSGKKAEPVNELKLQYSTSFTYDSNGNRSETIKNPINNEPEIKLLYKYVDFDKQGNWRKMTILQDEKVVKTTDREFEYFE